MSAGELVASAPVNARRGRRLGGRRAERGAPASAARRARGNPAAPLGDVAPVPATRWSGPAAVDVAADVPVAGVFLGLDRTGAPVTLPAVQPRLVRIGLPNAPGLAVLLAYRLLGVGSQVTAVTPGGPQWTALQAAVGGRRLVLLPAPPTWPPAPPSPPGTAPGHQVLVVELPYPPPLWLGGEWCTVLHATAGPPGGSDFWQSADLLVLPGPGYGAAVTQRWHRVDPVVADLRGAEVAVADQRGTRAVSIALTPHERDLVAAAR